MITCASSLLESGVRISSWKWVKNVFTLSKVGNPFWVFIFLFIPIHIRGVNKNFSKGGRGLIFFILSNCTSLIHNISLWFFLIHTVTLNLPEHSSKCYKRSHGPGFKFSGELDAVIFSNNAHVSDSWRM